MKYLDISKTTRCGWVTIAGISGFVSQTITKKSKRISKLMKLGKNGVEWVISAGLQTWIYKSGMSR